MIALSYSHIEAVFPYISDTGALPPEAGFFDQLMDIAAILGMRPPVAVGGCVTLLSAQ